MYVCVCMCVCVFVVTRPSLITDPKLLLREFAKYYGRLF